MVNFSSASFYHSGTAARRSGARKSSRIMRQRFQNKPVKSILKKRKPVKPVKQNTKAITTLSKQVRQLQLSKYGFKQYQYQYAILDSANPLTGCLVTTPLIFAMNSFYNLTTIYQGQVSATAVPSAVPTGINWEKQVYSVDLADQYQWTENNAQQLVSTVQYLPVYQKLKLTFTGSLKSTHSQPFAIRYRVTFFRLKNQSIASDVLNMELPDTAGAYWHLCDDNPSTRNHFSKMRHEVLMDRYVSIRPPNNANDLDTVYRTVEMPFSFPVKPIRFNKTAQPPNQKFYENVPQDDIIWCVISSNQTINNGINIQMERSLTWRDQHGVSTI